IEPESDSERLARRCACLADAREEEAERCAAMGPSLYPWGPEEKPRHDDTRRSHVLGQFPQGRPTPSPYQTTTPSTSHPNSSSALGDTHDIGKNLVKIMLEASGFEIVDLGRDIPPQRFVDEAIKVQASVNALSTLMTTTMDGMADVIQLLQKANLSDRFKVIGGGP